MQEIGIPPEALPVWVGGSHPGTPMFDILLKQISDGCLAAAVALPAGGDSALAKRLEQAAELHSV